MVLEEEGVHFVQVGECDYNAIDLVSKGSVKLNWTYRRRGYSNLGRGGDK